MDPYNFAMPTEPREHDGSPILAQVAQGDRVAFERFYDRYSSLVYTLALRILRTRADAEDLVQEVFLQVWRRAESYRPERGSVESWLLTMARNRALDRYRAANTMKRAHQLLQNLTPASDSLPAQRIAILDESRSVVRSALGRLAHEQRRVLELAYYDGLSQSQIAAHLGVPLGTVKTRIRSAVERLRRTLRGSEDPEDAA
ncbi:MAG: sigma-70 family RNA polymerase sigma factor [Isosphaeraceae bacterium]